MDKPCLLDCEAALALYQENQNIKEERAKRETLWLEHQRNFLDKNLKLERENEKLKIENEKLRECLEDYAEPYNWRCEEEDSWGEYNPLHLKCWRKEKQGYYRAQQCLKELEAGSDCV